MISLGPPPPAIRFSGLKKSRKALSTVIKNLAATESNGSLKECLFALAEKQQGLADLNVYEQCCEEALMALDDAKSGILAPMRDVVFDYNQAVTKMEATTGKNKAPEPIHEQRIFQVTVTFVSMPPPATCAPSHICDPLRRRSFRGKRCT